MVRKSSALAIAEKAQLWLDVGCGGAKIQGCVGMDRREVDGVDIVHDAETFPWPFEDETFDRIYMSHLMEHLNPKYHVEIMDEMWRIMKVGGVLALSMPYPGSHGHWQDPTHIKPWNETTPHYFDPDCGHKDCILYGIYRPKPWKIEGNVWNNLGNIEIMMRKRDVDSAG